MTIIRNSISEIHTFMVADAIKYGVEKSIILNSIDNFRDVPKESLHYRFPYFDKDDFYNWIDELIEKGELYDDKKGVL